MERIPAREGVVKLRGLRRELYHQAVEEYGSEQDMPPRLRCRLEREPILRSDTERKQHTYSEVDLSMIFLFSNRQLNTLAEGKIQDAYTTRLALHNALAVSPLSRDERNSISHLFHSDKDAFACLKDVMYLNLRRSLGEDIRDDLPPLLLTT